jgi:hypothetical protein
MTMKVKNESEQRHGLGYGHGHELGHFFALLFSLSFLFFLLLNSAILLLSETSETQIFSPSTANSPRNSSKTPLSFDSAVVWRCMTKPSVNLTSFEKTFWDVNQWPWETCLMKNQS